MKTIWISVASFVLATGMVASQTNPKQHRTLPAPTYYIAAEGQLWDENTVRVRGASNLPIGANISIQVAEFTGDGWKDYSESLCVTLTGDGLFKGEVRPKPGMKFRRNLIVWAAFATNLCKQPSTVLKVVGKKGQYLGNDNYDNVIDVSMTQTKGMLNNPQLFQTSGWFFGLEAINRLH
jgi:hypothetical protein